MTEMSTGTESDDKGDTATVPGVAEDLQHLWKKMGPVDGVYLPVQLTGAPSWSVKAEALRHMKLRDDDVFLLTYPKSGTHWLWEVISRVRRETTEPMVDTKVQFMMEFVDVDVLNELPSPRLLNTHLPLSMLPLPEIIARGLKIVHLYRNPKSTCVSYFHHARSVPHRLPVPIGTFQEFFEYFFFSNRQVYGSYFDYMKKIHEFQQQNPQVPLLNIAFEDVKKEGSKCVQQIARFLGKDLSNELCTQIADSCSFDNLKAQHATIKQMPKLRAPPKSEEITQEAPIPRPVIFRKGEIADWKNYFTVSMSERVDNLIATKMAGLPFTITFE